MAASAGRNDASEHGRQASLSIAEVSERTGLSSDTLRYYEKAGLIDAVRRSTGGQRRYAAADLDWIAFLLRLRDTGMSIANMQRFAELRRGGNAGIGDRLALLAEHRAGVERQIRLLRANLRVLDQKIDHYRDLLRERSETEDR
jgi:DNA-binding transcriptional MerR regulator